MVEVRVTHGPLLVWELIWRRPASSLLNWRRLIAQYRGLTTTILFLLSRSTKQ